jgi:hypothetical protein
MEGLFSPCTRLRDIAESQGIFADEFGAPNLELLRELNLDVSTEEFLSAERAFTFADIYAMIGNEDTIAWLTPHAAVSRRYGTAEHAWSNLDETCELCCGVDGEDIVTFANSAEHLLEINDIVLRLLAESVIYSVLIHENDTTCITAPTLAYFMEQCQSLKVLTLKDLEIDENHCRVLGDYSRPGLEIVLGSCIITSAGASALAEALGRNQGPTKLDCCYIDNSVLANMLRGNSSLQSLTPVLNRYRYVISQELLAIAGALRENKGLVDLDLSYKYIMPSNETWGAFCDSLKTHPTLEVLNLRGAFPDTASARAVIKPRMQALVDMMKVNMSIHTIHLHDRYSEHDLFRRSVIPYLETNRFRPRLLAIQQTRPIPYRAKVLGRALLSARTDANCFWMLLSGNAEVAFPSTTAAGNLTTPATFAATGNVAPVVATASTTDASSVVASAAGQKRKACP